MKKFIKSMITLAIIIAVLAFAGCAGEEPSASATPAPTASAVRQVNQISKTPLRKVKHIGIMYGIPRMKMTPSKM